LRHSLELILVRLALGTLSSTPRSIADLLAGAYVRLLDLALPKLRRTAMHNLEMALPDLTQAERRRITDGSFRSLARMLVSFAHFPKLDRGNIFEWIRYEGYEHYQEALARGRGVLFATAHLGNWELSAFAHGLLSAPMHIVVRPLDNPRLDALIERYRGLSGNRVIEKKDLA
jgi:KDO2-lipid IV(A) lauroyltransferase